MDWNNLAVEKAKQLLESVSKEKAVELIKKVIIPTLESESDIVFWEDVMKAVYNTRDWKDSKFLEGLKGYNYNSNIAKLMEPMTSITIDNKTDFGHLKEMRAQVIKKWKDSGLLDGLEGYEKDENLIPSFMKSETLNANKKTEE